jgi:hypothetical protein
MRLLRNTLGTFLLVAWMAFNQSTTHASMNWDCDYYCAGVTSVMECWLQNPYPQIEDSCTPSPYYQGPDCHEWVETLCGAQAYPWFGFISSYGFWFESEFWGEVGGGYICEWTDEINGCTF